MKCNVDRVAALAALTSLMRVPHTRIRHGFPAGNRWTKPSSALVGDKRRVGLLHWDLQVRKRLQTGADGAGYRETIIYSFRSGQTEKSLSSHRTRAVRSTARQYGGPSQWEPRSS